MSATCLDMSIIIRLLVAFWDFVSPTVENFNEELFQVTVDQNPVRIMVVHWHQNFLDRIHCLGVEDLGSERKQELRNARIFKTDLCSRTNIVNNGF